MRKFLVLLVLVLSLCFAFACGKEDEKQDDKENEQENQPSEKVGYERIKENGKLVVGFTDFAPFGYVENDEYKGFDLDLAKLVAAELGVDVEFKYIDWEAQVAEINTNVDCIWNAMTITPKRQENMEFTKPYWETNLVAVVKADSELTSVAELAGKKISVEANGTADINLSGSDDYDVKQYTTVSEARTAVTAGQADAFVADATYVEDVLSKYAGEYKVLEGTIGDVEEYGVAFRKAEGDLRDKVDEIIDELYFEGKIDALLEKYFGEGNGFKREVEGEEPEEKEYTVKFVVDGEETSIVVKEGEKATKPADPEKEGYTFVGWFAGEEVYDFEAAVTADVELVAKFEVVTEAKIGLDRIKENGKLVVGFTDFAPFGYVENDEYKGFDLDLAKLVAAELGVDVEFKYIDWDAQVAEINTNVDCIWNAMTITPKRQENMEFTKPYWETNLVAVVKADSELTSVAELAGKKISVEANGTADINLSGSDDYDVKQYTTVSEARTAVTAGQADAFVADATYVEDVLSKYAGEYKVLEGTIGDVEEYGVAFRKAEGDLRDKVDEIIDELYFEGKIDALLEKYFGEGNGFKREQ